MMTEAMPEVAFYYPGPVWRSSEAVKNLLLFFDGVALLVPDYIRDKPERLYPELAVPLLERRLLHLVSPEEHVDQAATEQLADAMVDLIAKGVLDELASARGDFHELSMSRLGYFGDEGLAQMLFEELKKRSLAKDSEDGVSIPMHRGVRALILVLLAQILRPRGRSLGMQLLPATDRPMLVKGLTDLLGASPMPSAGQVVAADLNAVGVDLGSVPLDEVLDYRNQHRQEYARYAREVRSFVRSLSILPPEDRTASLTERAESLRDHAASLRARAKTAWGTPTSLAFSGVGAIWTAVSGDPLGALFAAVSLLGSARQASGAEEVTADAFSYVLSLPGYAYG